MSKYMNQDYKQGLSFEQVNQRKKDKLVNKETKLFKKPNAINIHNILLIVLVAFAAINTIAIAIVLLNVFVGIFADMKIAIFRRFLNKPTPRTTVVREGAKMPVDSNEVVLDDIVYLQKGDAITVDGTILEGEIGIDENNINGSSAVNYKCVTANVFKGSTVVDGTAYIKADKVGNACFINQLHKKTKKIRRPIPGLLKFIDIFAIVSTALGALAFLLIFVSYAAKGNGDKCVDAIIKYFPIIIPYGIGLLSIYCLLVHSHLVIRREKIYVQDLYSFPSLNDIDVICFDKTGTLTNHELVLRKTVLFDGRVPDSLVAQKISNILCAVNENSLLNKALKKEYDLELSSGVNQVLHFSDENNYMGASFKGGKTLLIGLPEYMQVKNKAGVLKRCEEYTKEGLSVYVLAEGEGSIKDNKYVGELEPIAMIILEESIKEDVGETFKWFVENNIDIKIISGDDAQVTSALCYQAGLKEAINYISLENVSLRDVKRLADKYTVFGNASAEQKEMIIKTLQESKKKVAMVGDGDNDILALKRAYLSICTDDSSNAVKTVSKVVISSKKINSLIELTERGKNFTNNFKRAVSFFAFKTLFAFIITVASMVAMLANAFEYPFKPTYFLLWDFITSGVVATLLMFDKSRDQNKDSLLASTLKKSIPAAALLSVGVISVFVAYVLQNNKVINLGINSIETAITMCILVFTGLGAFVLYKICTPLNKYRRYMIAIYGGANALLLLIEATVSYQIKDAPFVGQIPFYKMSAPAYIASIIIVAVLAAIYILVYNVVESFKKGDSNEN